MFQILDVFFKMLTMLGIRKKYIFKVVLLQVLITIPVLYMTRDRLFMYLNIQWTTLLPVDSKADNYTYHGIDLMRLVSTLGVKLVKCLPM